MSELQIIVQKYGGTSVASPERIMVVAERIKTYVDAGKSIAVVVSAMGKTTDELVALANAISKKPDKREMDVLLSTGEQVTIALLAMALHEIGVDAVSYTGTQVNVMTDGNFSNARIESIKKGKMLESLKDKKVVIVAGFQGMDEEGNITTLGRGGSDTSAVAIATVLGARECEIYTDVDGVYSADPRVVKHPKKQDVISYDEMLELSRLGASVLHSRSVEFAKKFGVWLHVRSSFKNEKGTIVKSREDIVEKAVVRGVTAKTDEARITIRDIPDKPGVAARLFGKLSEKKIYVNMIVQSMGHDQISTISITVLKTELDEALKCSKELQSELGASTVDHKEDIAIVSAVGVGMISSYGVAAKIFKLLSDKNINIEMISTSEIGISCVIDEIYGELATKILHKELIENE